MKTYLALFDILGFKSFIEEHTTEEIERRFEHVLRDSSRALSNIWIDDPIDAGRINPDLEYQKVHCLHISDTIIFWTDSDTDKDFMNLIDVSQRFYTNCLTTSLPVRGCIVHGDIKITPSTMTNKNNNSFYNYSMYGKSYVEAHETAESLEISACIIAQSAIDRAGEIFVNGIIKENFALMFRIPHKSGTDYCLSLKPKLYIENEAQFMNIVKGIKSNFAYLSNKKFKELPDSVKNKANNTIDLIKHSTQNILKK